MIVYDLTEDGFCTQRLCRYLNVSPQAYYRWLRKGKPMYRWYDEQLADRIQALFEPEMKGYRFIRDQLIRLDQRRVNDKTVLRYMHILWIQSPIRKKRLPKLYDIRSQSKGKNRLRNVLARNFEASRPLENW